MSSGSDAVPAASASAQKPGQEKGEVALPRDARLMMSLLHTMGVVSNLLLLPYGVGASI